MISISLSLQCWNYIICIFWLECIVHKILEALAHRAPQVRMNAIAQRSSGQKVFIKGTCMCIPSHMSSSS